jgi:NAD(P)-dependent dehydrogenase (short-subunit alcohol dehydrogenase family)
MREVDRHLTLRTIAQLLELTGHVAAVTGSGRGIGRAIAFQLVEAGAAVLLANVDREAVELLATQIAGRASLRVLKQHVLFSSANASPPADASDCCSPSCVEKWFSRYTTCRCYGSAS